MIRRTTRIRLLRLFSGFYETATRRPCIVRIVCLRITPAACIMDLPTAIDRFLSKPGVEESCPFGPDVLVYKVGGKIFALTMPDEFPARINLKCDPERSLVLRDEHEAILPGYHMNKRHGNTLVLDGSLPSKLVEELIDHSYQLVAASLPRPKRK